jgi:hypothetical protein
MPNKKRDYNNDFLSVTEVLSKLRKVGLEMWYKNNSSYECDRISKKSKEIGSQLHSLLENFIVYGSGETSINSSFQEEISNALNGFIAFKNEHPCIKLKWAELQLSNDILKLNGTIDCIGEENDNLVLIDWKTGECKNKALPPIYPEYILQVAAYAALYNLDKNQQMPVSFSIIKKAYIVVLSKDKPFYNILELDETILKAAFKAFNCVLQYCYSQKELNFLLKEEKK